MPSPGITTLKSDLAIPFTVEGGFNTSILLSGETNTRLATGMHNGWTSATPTTPTQMETSIAAAFAGYINVSGSTGNSHLLCLGIGIDEEIAAWVASWDSDAMVHTFVVTAASIEARIIACYPWNSNATAALAAGVAQTFANYFGQEVG